MMLRRRFGPQQRALNAASQVAARMYWAPNRHPAVIWVFGNNSRLCLEWFSCIVTATAKCHGWSLKMMSNINGRSR